MNPREFFINPADYGVPARDELVSYRIWDNHFHGFLAQDPIKQYEQNSYFVDRMGIERSISQEIGGTLDEPLVPYRYDEAILKILERDKDRLLGRTPIDPAFPEQSCAKIEKWIRDGPCIGIKYSGGLTKGVRCNHPNNDQIMRLAQELDSHVYVHTWLKLGGKPRLPGGDNLVSESTPMELAELAIRFPKVTFICGHTGGDWELGVRAVRSCKNVFVEFAGSDPHSGMVDYAVKELGIDRLVWGGHGPSRSYATELGKVLDADLSRNDRMKILGSNLRRVCAPMFARKGWKLKL